MSNCWENWILQTCSDSKGDIVYHNMCCWYWGQYLFLAFLQNNGKARALRARGGAVTDKILLGEKQK